MKISERFNWHLLSKYRTELYGISAIAIVLFHMKKIVPFPYIIPGLNLDVTDINNTFNLGVDVFLLLSGISLYFAYQKKTDYFTYLKRRWQRVLIPYLIISFPYYVFLLCLNKEILRFLLNISGISLYISYEEG